MPPRVIIFSNSFGGHRPLFHGLITGELLQRGATVLLMLPEPAAGLPAYRDLLADEKRVGFAPLPGAGNQRGDRLARLKLLHRRVAAERPGHVLLDLIDDLIPFLWASRLGQKQVIEAPWSAFHLRVCLHYGELKARSRAFYRPAVRLREEARFFLLKRLARGHNLRALFTNDEFAPGPYNRRLGRPLLRRVPDPVAPAFFRAPAQREAARAELGLAPGEVLFLAYGHHVPVKATEVTIRAFASLAGSLGSGAARLLVAGPIEDPAVRAALAQPAARALVQNGRLLVREKFLNQDESARLFAAMDFLVAPYRDHFGISAGLFKALAAGRGAIISDENWMDLFARRHGLGLVCRAGDPASLAETMARALEQGPPPPFPEIDYYRAENFQRIIGDAIMPGK